MADHSLDALTHEREQLKHQLLDRLMSLADLVARIHANVEDNDSISWWADHPQSLGHRATEADRLLNRVVTLDRAIRLVTEAQEYDRDTFVVTVHGNSQGTEYTLTFPGGRTVRVGDAQEAYWKLANGIDLAAQEGSTDG